jgi:hypothetical protein
MGQQSRHKRPHCDASKKAASNSGFFFYTPPRSASALSPIDFQEFDAQKYRDFVRTLSDEALIREGKKMRWLSGDGKIVSTMPSAFDEQLKICRAK